MTQPGEIDFYPEISEKIKRELSYFLGDNYSLATSFNKLLPLMVEEIEEELSVKSELSECYIPRLKLDILLGVKNETKKTIVLVLLEVKYKQNLSLIDFSQLTGYLNVAQSIPIGILLLVRKRNGMSPISDDLSEIIEMGLLPLDCRLCIEGKGEFQLNYGFCFFVPSNGITWKDTDRLGGISNFESLASKVKRCLDD